MFRITDTCDSLPVGGTIVRGEDYAAGLQADHLLMQAQADAEQILLEAREEYERQQEQGYADGTEEAQAQAAERMHATIAAATKYFTTVEQRAVQVVQKALYKILGEMNEQELVIRAVRHALSWARSQSRVRLRVAPACAHELQDRIEQIRNNYPAIEVIDVEADDHLKLRDCILETEIGTVDASIDVQLAALSNALQQAFRDPSLTAQRQPLSGPPEEVLTEEPLYDGLPDDGLPDDGLSDDGLSDDGLSDDGLPDDGLPDDGLPDDGLPDDGLSDDGLSDDGLSDDGLPDDGFPDDDLPDDD